MFNDFKRSRGSIWKSSVNSFIGSVFLGVCALWAIIVICQASWGVNPVAQAFTNAVAMETQVSN
ncbi:MAG TPA: hypothetical protein VG934_03375 [Candidatus Paceibacterota bacterium]|nr:hypothetical protein [Candidatus Paceibacterota bacterium]